MAIGISEGLLLKSILFFFKKGLKSVNFTIDTYRKSVGTV